MALILQVVKNAIDFGMIINLASFGGIGGLWYLLGRIQGDIKRLDEKVNRHLDEK